MSTVARELDRLGRAEARARARPWARRVQLLLLGAAVLLAALQRWAGPLPGLAALEGRPVAVLAVALGLLAAGPLLAWLGPWLWRPRAATLARRLDEAPGGHDEVATALDAERGRARGALAAVLVAQVAARLAGRAAAARTPRLWAERPMRLLAGLGALAFACLLLLPGVRGADGEGHAGRGPQPGLGWRTEEAREPLEADAWLREHLRLVLEPARAGVPGGEAWLRLRVAADARLPAGVELLAGLELLWDDADAGRRAVAEVGELATQGGEVAPLALDLDLRALPALAGRLTPGLHVAQARLVPRADPFRQAQRSLPLEVEIPPPQAGGAPPPAPSSPPPPAPAPPPPPPPPAPEPPGPGPQPRGSREEAIVPFINPGETVRKERAVVAARAPEAALAPPPPQPLEEALREPARVAEQAVARERIAPADRDFVRRYFQVLRQLVEGPPR